VRAISGPRWCLLRGPLAPRDSASGLKRQAAQLLPLAGTASLSLDESVSPGEMYAKSCGHVRVVLAPTPDGLIMR